MLADLARKTKQPQLYLNIKNNLEKDRLRREE
jgi:hypothetical protein